MGRVNDSDFLDFNPVLISETLLICFGDHVLGDKLICCLSLPRDLFGGMHNKDPFKKTV